MILKMFMKSEVMKNLPENFISSINRGYEFGLGSFRNPSAGGPEKESDTTDPDPENYFPIEVPAVGYQK
jgi:hypothetical protein